MRIGITGHRDLPAAIACDVDEGIRALLAQYAGTALTGVSCLADGADQLFAQAILDAGGRLMVIVPAAEYRDGLPSTCHAAYDALLAKASDVLKLPFSTSDPQAHMAASSVMLSRIDLLVAVWDGKPARGFGGTADVVREARDCGLPVAVVWPAGAERPA